MKPFDPTRPDPAVARVLAELLAATDTGHIRLSGTRLADEFFRAFGTRSAATLDHAAPREAAIAAAPILLSEYGIRLSVDRSPGRATRIHLRLNLAPDPEEAQQ
ncbi:hypothetical protein [Micromonospora coxensis]|uniref:hypothetical protein n=1 Tax=Micromonospora coxensis TaxID=356852 RepID=UPI003426028B